MQICEQIIEKKNGFGLDFYVFFSQVEYEFCNKKIPSLLLIDQVKKNTTQMRVRYADTDQMGIVYYGNYAQYLEQGRTEWLRDLGFSYKWMEENDILLPVIELQIKYKQPARYDDLLTVTTMLRNIPTIRIEFDYQIHNQEGVLLIEAFTSLVFKHGSTQKLIKAPDYLLEKLKES